MSKSPPLLASIDFSKMEDHNFFKNGRRPQLSQKRKTIPIFSKMEDDLNFFKNGRRSQSFYFCFHPPPTTHPPPSTLTSTNSAQLSPVKGSLA
jgi:hypothetical protein